MDNFGEKLRKNANELADWVGEAAHSAGERIAEMREIQRLNTVIRDRKREKDRCKMTMADLLIRMFDQNTFAEALLRPEYARIKELDAELAGLEEERRQVTAAAQTAAETVESEETAAPEKPVVPDSPKDLEEPDETVPPETPPGRETYPPDITAQE
ncbi:MAG: hypothetical protein ACYDCO_24895 [Armatimonadota bacterium]